VAVDTYRLSVVVVNYNTREDLRRCLTSLSACDPRPEIVVVDNASSDGSLAMVARHFPHVVQVAPGHNTWFTGGNNLGASVAHGDYVLLLNPDTVVPSEALARLLAFAGAHPEYAGVTAQLHYPDTGAVQRTCSRLPTYAFLLANHTPLGWLLPAWRVRLNARHWYDDWARDTSRAVDVAPGSCILGRRDNLRLDEDLLLYFPEDDLGRRCGPGRFYFLAEARIAHRESASTATFRARRIYFRDLYRYTRKHHGAARAVLLWLLSRPLLWGLWAKHAAGGRG
jgi:GT2 family glycosyltransferase